MLKPLTLSSDDTQAIDKQLEATEKRLTYLRHRVEEIKQLIAKSKAAHDQLSVRPTPITINSYL